MKNAIKYKSNGNCYNFDDDVFCALLEFKFSKKKDICNIIICNVNEIYQEVLNRSILLNSTNSIVNYAKSKIHPIILYSCVVKKCHFILIATVALNHSRVQILESTIIIICHQFIKNVFLLKTKVDYFFN